MGEPPSSLPSSINVISLNCWGLKYISQHRRERLQEIGRRLATAIPQPHVVGLQECWTQEDFHAIREQTKHILPYGKFFHSGFFGSGLVILSAWPMLESSMYAYPLNGRPAAFYRGDWYVGKGVASARIQLGPETKDILEIFCTHLHAPYEPEHMDNYACHRTAQAWEIAKLMRHAAERGHMVIGLGDFNMLPGSLAYRIIEACSPMQDCWQAAHNEGIDLLPRPTATVKDAVEAHGATCDSAWNTWRWSKQMKKELRRGKVPHVDPNQLDPDAKRLDYIFFHMPQQGNSTWSTSSARVGMIERHSSLHVSLSDHFSVEITLSREVRHELIDGPDNEPIGDKTMPGLTSAELTEILDLVDAYTKREEQQQFWQLVHFSIAIAVSVACLGSIWAVVRIWAAFLLALASTLILSSGLMSGLLGGLFVKQELNALKEFRWEIQTIAAG